LRLTSKYYSLVTFVLALPLIFLSFTIYSQNYSFVSGKITDMEYRPVEFVNIYIEDYSSGTTSDRNGNYELKVAAGKDIVIIFSCVGYKIRKQVVNLKPDQRIELNLILEVQPHELKEFIVSDNQVQKTNMTRIDPKLVQIIPDVSGNFEAILKTLPGVSKQ